MLSIKRGVQKLSRIASGVTLVVAALIFSTKPSNDLACTVEYLPHETYLIIPFSYVCLVNANCIDPKQSARARLTYSFEGIEEVLGNGQDLVITPDELIEDLTVPSIRERFIRYALERIGWGPWQIIKIHMVNMATDLVSCSSW